MSFIDQATNRPGGWDDFHKYLQIRAFCVIHGLDLGIQVAMPHLNPTTG